MLGLIGPGATRPFKIQADVIYTEPWYLSGSGNSSVERVEQMRKRYPDAGGEDYIFLPDYTNSETAARIFARQFNVLLDKTELKHNPITNPQRSVYCLRHTAVCMRIILSDAADNWEWSDQRNQSMLRLFS